MKSMEVRYEFAKETEKNLLASLLKYLFWKSQILEIL